MCGNVDGALKLYRTAMAGTAEAVRRNPRDPQALFDHAQNVFYVGQIAHDRGIGGPLLGPSAYFMKSPPIQYRD